MFDTVIIRQHDLKKNIVIKNMLEFEDLNSYTQFIKLIKKNDLLQKNIEAQKKLIKFGDGELKLSKHRNKYELPSHHYGVAYHIDYEKDYIEYNFSIPKYLYGNNIAQVVKYSKAGFDFYKWSDFNNQYSNAWSEFVSSVKFFFYQMFESVNPNARVDFSDIEICRVDLCFNQIFPNKEEAQNYIQYQKRLYKKYERKTTDKGQSYKSSFYYNLPGIFLKIYHKGNEYRKHDKSEHLIRNAILVESLEGVNELNLFDTDYLQSIADRIVRYEVEFKSAKLSEIYNKEVLINRSPVFALKYKIYQKVKKETDDGEKLIECDEDGVVTWQVNKDEYAIYKKIKKDITKRRSFMLAPKFHEGRRGENIVNPEYYRSGSIVGVFNEALFNECIKIFKRFVNHFQVKAINNIDQVLEDVSTYNKRIEEQRELLKQRFKQENRVPRNGEIAKITGQKIDSSKMAMIVSLIKEYGSLSDVRRNCDINGSTFRNYRAKLKKLNIKENMFTDFSEVHAPLDFSQYYLQERDNYMKLKPV